MCKEVGPDQGGGPTGLMLVLAVAGGFVRPSQPVQRVGLIGANAEIAPHVDGTPIARDCREVRAEPVVCVAEAVPGVRLSVPLAELLVQPQRRFTPVHGVVVRAELCMAPADRI